MSGMSPKAGERLRLPPGQRLVTGLPVLDLGDQPLIAPGDWTLTIGGAVGNALRWDWDIFLSQPQTRIQSDIHCVTAWSSYDNEFEGVSTGHLVDAVCPRKGAAFLMARSHDGYSTNVALEDFKAEGGLLAHRWNGKPIPREHGGPVRLVLPGLYFWKSAKWVRHISFMDRDQPGYWEARGYHNHGDPWAEERYE